MRRAIAAAEQLTPEEADEREQVARSLLEQTGCDDPPVSMLDLATCLGFEIRHAPILGGRLVGDVIEVDMRARPERVQLEVGHELAHDAQRRAGLPDTEAGADYIAAAALLPKRHFERDLKVTQWSIEKLRAKHVNASAELCARRIADLREAVVIIFDRPDGKPERDPRRIVSRLIDRTELERMFPCDVRRIRSGKLPAPSDFERDLAATVFESGATLQWDTLAWAVPVFTPGYRRVIVVAEARQLSLRLR